MAISKPKPTLQHDGICDKRSASYLAYKGIMQKDCRYRPRQ